jgi:hypothetical protein
MVSAKRRPSPKSHFVHEWCVPGRDESLYSSELSNVNDGSGNYNRATTTGCGFDDREDNPCDVDVSPDQTYHGRICVP